MSSAIDRIAFAAAPRHRYRLRFWPRSLAGRTALSLMLALAVVQALGLTIHAFDRIGLERMAQARMIGIRLASIYRTVEMTDAPDRPALLKEVSRTGAVIDRVPPSPDLPPLAPFVQQTVQLNMNLVPIPANEQWRELMLRAGPKPHQLLAGMQLPDGAWLKLRMEMPPPTPWHSPTFLIAFLLMTAAAAVLILWAVRRLTEPVRTLAAAAERLGRDVNAPPMLEEGPTEIATAAAAFNTMAARIRRFVQDRTFLLTAIGHDLRTPITRLKLRAEFVEDEEQRRKMLADLDELESMVAATLAFGRDDASSEPVAPLDLSALLRTVLDEAGDARPELADQLELSGPAHLIFPARPMALKRALANLIGNAVAYGGAARVTLSPPKAGTVFITIDDDGPGIPPGELDRVFEPFHRVEGSRNRETGGTGLGLPIARNILRGHGGDVVLANRPHGGARVTVTLPV
ncbi:MAG TPA: ATP-binding protein [Acetobacteraceae bacterium]|nr:ATP-binding protein [Acetobacteraceae bacterium]